MDTLLPALNLVAALAILFLLALVWHKLKQPIGQNLDQALREELRVSRDEASGQARGLREEVATAQTNANAVLVSTVNALGENQKNLLGELTKATQEAAAATRGEVEKLVQRTSDGLKDIQNTTKEGLEAVRQATEVKLQASQEAHERRGAEVTKAVKELTEANRKELDAQREKIHAQLQQVQQASDERLAQVRRTLDEKLQLMMEEQRKQLAEVVTALKDLEKTHQEEQKKAREGLDLKFQQIQQSNEQKLEEMRKTVDEKLHDTLEKRLGESFKLVSERLEAVQRGLGEMQSLATGVGDLKRVLTNVKERGTWGEYQLGAILEQIFTPDQYGRNVRVQDERETVEFAVKLPGKESNGNQPVWLPIDAKFPKEDYERLMAAAAAADTEGVKQATKDLLNEVSGMAKDIHKKYIAPPFTTDFGILFLPTEGLYAEVLRQPGFHDELQQKYRVLVAGPTTLAAILSSLRVGFQTLAIEKRAGEVWTVLGAVKTEFGKFGEVLTRVKKQLKTATRTLDETGVRTRVMEDALDKVQQLPGEQATTVLGLQNNPPPAESEDTDESSPIGI
ncbi:MAG TPA: DNA recombination protein RmuC [Verrucomicrobiae bacterium]